MGVKSTQKMKQKYRLIKNLQVSIKSQQMQLGFLLNEARSFMGDNDYVYDYQNTNKRFFEMSTSVGKDTAEFRKLLIEELGERKVIELERKAKTKVTKRLLVK